MLCIFFVMRRKKKKEERRKKKEEKRRKEEDLRLVGPAKTNIDTSTQWAPEARQLENDPLFNTK